MQGGGGEIDGGTLKTSAGGEILVQGFGGNVISGVTIAAGSLVEIGGGALTLEGTINNSGTVMVDVGLSAVLLIGAPGVRLQGGGTVSMGNARPGFIRASGGAATLTNVNDTIRGVGTIGDANLTLVNSGTVNATGSALTISTGANTITNASGGTLEATGAGTLAVSSTVVNSGMLFASGAGCERRVRRRRHQFRPGRSDRGTRPSSIFSRQRHQCCRKDDRGIGKRRRANSRESI